jgi:hypothetical protein
MPSSGMLRSVALVRIDVSEELISSIIRVERIRGLGKTLALTGNSSRRRHILSSTFYIMMCLKQSTSKKQMKLRGL